MPGPSSTTRDPRYLVDELERNRYRYDGIRYNVERYGAAECERLLGRGSRGNMGHVGVTSNRVQRMAVNGEALKYIELVLQQLRRASRDHQELVRQRHTDFQHEISKRINERAWHHRDERQDSIDASRTWSRSSGSPWESDVTLRKTRPDVTTRLLTKRRDYGGTAQNTVDILRPGPSGRVHDGITATAYQEMKYVPDKVGWKGARETFGAWSLPEASSNNDGKTSSTVV